MSDPKSLLVYGATGYTGRLIVALAVSRGMKPIVAGRARAAVEDLARSFGLESRTFALSDRATVAASLGGVGAVLHCAGPFAHTFRPMVEGCMDAGAHYLDITGEIEVFESIRQRTTELEKAGVMAMPGVGFDVVPTDCLAAHLKARLPDATHLAMAFRTVGGRLSHGTATTMVENLHRGGVVREDGKLRSIPTSSRSRQIDFGRGATHCVAIPWGDVSTAFATTGIANIEVYIPMPRAAAIGSQLIGKLGGLMGSAPVQRFLKARVDARPAGPTDDERASAFTLLWGEAKNAAGASVVTRMKTAEGYTLTAEAAVRIAERVLAGEAQAGFRTPASVFGADFVLSLPGTTRDDA
jgi:short subunit dehydrogenase-like uncharacterized protein